MNCPNCSSLTKDNAKFCTDCGFRLASTEANILINNKCQSCGAFLKNGAKFCTSCGDKVTAVQQFIEPLKQASVVKSNPISSIKNRIFWNIQQGEVAHRFNEVEMVNYDSASGIIINDGTTALIRANGIKVAEINGGTYDFLDNQQLENALNAREGGIVGSVRAGFRFLSNLVLGQKVKDKIDENESQLNPQDNTTLDGVIEGMKKGQLFSVTLRLDRSFPIIFNLKDVDTKMVSSNFGVHTLLKIDDFTLFAEHFLSDQSSATLEKIMLALEGSFKEAIEQVVHNIEITSGRLSDDVISKIKNNINQIPKELLFGIKLEKIIQVSSNGEDLDRLKTISRELYLPEKELEHLINKNLFQNKLLLVENTQKLTAAKNDAEFHRALMTINNSSTQDQLLSEDDMEKFYIALSREKRIREAKSEDDVTSALIEIEKTGLLRDEDLENLKTSIRERGEDRENQRFHSVALLQLNQTLELDRKQLEWEYDIGEKQIDLEISRRRKDLQAEIGYTQLEIEKWKTEQDYQDSVFYKELEKSKASHLQGIDLRRASRETEIDLDNKEMDAQLDRMRKLKDIEAAEAKLKHEQELASRSQEISHQQEMEEKRLKEVQMKYEGSKDLSPEQLMAIAANENLDPIAAQKFAESFSSKHNVEQQKEFMEQFKSLSEQRIADQKQMTSEKDATAEKDKDRLERILKEFIGSTSEMTNKFMDSTKEINKNFTAQKEKEKEEYKERLERQEDRLDKTQDKALDYTTRSNKPAPKETPPKQIKPNTPADPNSKVAPKQEKRSCKKCNYNQLDDDAKFCPECGNEPN